MQLAALSTEDLVSLVALPLAVAAVADVAGVPQEQLADLVATLNGANMPVAQEIQVIRYVPVALTQDNATPFVDFVQTQVTQGITGPALVPVVVERLQTFYPREERIVIHETSMQQPVVFEPVVVAARREHPHGGPPGQLKKQLGLKTGAEVVHVGRASARPLVVPPPMISSAPVVVHEHEKGGHGKGHDKGGHGEGHGGGKGHGKGH
jgi:hypothetical protein